MVVNYIQILYLCILKQLTKTNSYRSSVVNYIQILYLCILKQRVFVTILSRVSCELHSNLVSLHSETTNAKKDLEIKELWITFKSCIFAFWNNCIVIYVSDRLLWITFKSCIFAFWNNIINGCYSRFLLWITFKSCIFAFWNNRTDSIPYPVEVVNYIQILYLCILKQPQLK